VPRPRWATFFVTPATLLRWHRHLVTNLAPRSGTSHPVSSGRHFASWLMVTGRLTVNAHILGQVDLRLGNAAGNHCREAHRWFTGACALLNVREGDVALQWNNRSAHRLARSPLTMPTSRARNRCRARDPPTTSA
jgi:hypothetical protein